MLTIDRIQHRNRLSAALSSMLRVRWHVPLFILWLSGCGTWQSTPHAPPPAPALHPEARFFMHQARTVLPHYQALFQTAARQHPDPIDWQLLAAIGYQESHWHPRARSRTGVRGMMMLTRKTAQFVGVRNRINPRQSIQGGAKYLAHLLDQLPDGMPPDQKIPFALACYNMGMGHVRAAQRITARQGDDPHQWTDVQKRLVQLKRSQGQQAQTFVRRTMQYYQWLHHLSRSPALSA